MNHSTHPAAPVGDWRELDLSAGGRSLVEASAGTGKTWTISVLYLRLLLEQRLTPRQVVVTTFTNAAADELRERLRGRLLWAQARAVAGPGEVPDPALTDARWLYARWQGDDARRADDLQVLHVALAELDMAPVTTLHGLCQRILGDHPFAAGVPFDGGDLIDGAALLQTLAADVLRRVHQGGADDPLVGLHRASGIKVDRHTLARQIGLLLRPGHRMQAPGNEGPEAVLPGAWAGRLRALAARDELFNKLCALRRHWLELADFIDAPDGPVPGREALARLADAGKLTGVKAPCKTDPELLAAAAFSEDAAAAIEPLELDRKRRFWCALGDWAHAQVQGRLAASGQRTFDALLTTVEQALAAEAGEARPLADALFQAWPVALVDEFQDTDTVQYGILDRIYRAADGARRGRLVMIGDPKQAIYRFRGGDIHAYVQAARSADQTMTLGINRRSSRRFVRALNDFHALVGPELGADGGSAGICYEPVEASSRQDGTPYRIGGAEIAQPLVFHRLADAPAAAGERVSLALQACADQIADMLGAGTHAVGDRPLQAGDLAVLLPYNAHVDALKRLLQRRGVPCVATSRSSVFAGDAARELQVILYAVAHCDDLGPIRAAVATRLWGLDYGAVRALGDQPAGWLPLTRVFHQWRQDWLARGVLAVVDALVAKIAADQLATGGGERVLTDLRHLGELLQAQAAQTPGIEELLAWFTDQREGGSGDEEAADARQLRIESDAKRVRLMTLHASKGLEFQVVFLPLMWAHGEKDGGMLCAVQAGDGTGRVLDVAPATRRQENRELQDERFRVLYVALTRAVHACHVYALDPARPADGRSKSPAEGTKRSALDVMLARMEPAPGSAGLAAATPTIEWRDGWPRPVAHAVPVAQPPAPRQARPLPPLHRRVLPGKHSFTTLTRGLADTLLDPGAPANDERDADQLPEPEAAAVPGIDVLPEATPEAPAQPHPELLALAPVRGADFGNAVHAIFENRVPGHPLAGQRNLVDRMLREYKVAHTDVPPEALADGLARRLQAVLDAPLDPAGRMRLGALPAADLRAEMEFFFALDGASMRRLREACADCGEPALVPASERTLAGLMNGKIDLVFRHDGRFHVLDYKGNHLGDALEDYCGERLAAKMDQAHYRFQALIYTVAVERYLRQRLGPRYRRAEHLGDAWYLFIRAVGLQPGAGIWHARFGDALLDAVHAEFATTVTREAA